MPAARKTGALRAAINTHERRCRAHPLSQLRLSVRPTSQRLGRVFNCCSLFATLRERSQEPFPPPIVIMGLVWTPTPRRLYRSLAISSSSYDLLFHLCGPRGDSHTTVHGPANSASQSLKKSEVISGFRSVGRIQKKTIPRLSGYYARIRVL